MFAPVAFRVKQNEWFQLATFATSTKQWAPKTHGRPSKEEVRETNKDFMPRTGGLKSKFEYEGCQVAQTNPVCKRKPLYRGNKLEDTKEALRQLLCSMCSGLSSFQFNNILNIINEYDYDDVDFLQEKVVTLIQLEKEQLQDQIRLQRSMRRVQFTPTTFSPKQSSQSRTGRSVKPSRIVNVPQRIKFTDAEINTILTMIVDELFAKGIDLESPITFEILQIIDSDLRSGVYNYTLLNQAAVRDRVNRAINDMVSGTLEDPEALAIAIVGGQTGQHN